MDKDNGRESLSGSDLGWTGLKSDKYEVNVETIVLDKEEGDGEVSSVSLLNTTDKDQQFFMLYPQEITAWDKEKTIDDESDPATGAYIALLAKIQHNIEGEDEFTVYPTGDDVDPTDGEGQYGWVCVAVPTTTWQANKQYNYELTFEDNAIGYKKDGTPIVGTKELSFTVTSVNWDEDVTPDQPVMGGE